MKLRAKYKNVLNINSLFKVRRNIILKKEILSIKKSERKYIVLNKPLRVRPCISLSINFNEIRLMLWQ